MRSCEVEVCLWRVIIHTKSVAFCGDPNLLPGRLVEAGAGQRFGSVARGFFMKTRGFCTTGIRKISGLGIISTGVFCWPAANG